MTGSWANRVNAGFRRHRVSLEALGEAWKSFCVHRIPQSAKVAEAQYTHQPLALLGTLHCPAGASGWSRFDGSSR